MKESVRKLAAEWNESLHFAGPAYWKIDGVTDPQAFFHHLPKIFPHGMTLLIEGLEIGASARSLYEEHAAPKRKKVACDTISPTPDSYHVVFNSDFADRLCRLVESQGLATAFYHFKGYSEQEVVFTFHDAFDGELALSSSLGDATVEEFATSLGRKAERARFAVDLREQIIAMDRAMNPPWWKFWS